jgi:hypothetical protein
MKPEAGWPLESRTSPVSCAANELKVLGVPRPRGMVEDVPAAES